MALSDIFSRKPPTSSPPGPFDTIVSSVSPTMAQAEVTDHTVPECMRFESEEMSKFGTQVQMSIDLTPGEWSVHESLRQFVHDDLGHFEISDDGTVRHFGDRTRKNYGALRTPGNQRALTKGDSKAIVEALRAMLLNPIDFKKPQAEQTAKMPPSAITVLQQAQQAQQQQINAQAAQQQMGLQQAMGSLYDVGLPMTTENYREEMLRRMREPTLLSAITSREALSAMSMPKGGSNKS